MKKKLKRRLESAILSEMIDTQLDFPQPETPWPT